MLGFLYKVAHKQTHPAFSTLFPFAPARDGYHDKQLVNHVSSIVARLQLWRRSIFSLVSVFNCLPQHVVDLEDVSTFQTWLSDWTKLQCNNGNANWYKLFDSFFPIRANFV